MVKKGDLSDFEHDVVGLVLVLHRSAGIFLHNHLGITENFQIKKKYPVSW